MDAIHIGSKDTGAIADATTLLCRARSATPNHGGIVSEPMLDPVQQKEAKVQEVLHDTWKRIKAGNFHSGSPRSPSTVDAVRMCEAALVLASGSNNKTHTAEACRMMAYTLSANEQYAESVRYYRESLERLDSIGDPQRAARMRLGFIGALSMTSDYREALKQAEIAEAGFITAGDETGQARLYTNVGNLYFRREEYTSALEYHRKARTLFEKLRDRNAVAVSSLNLGNSLSSVERFAEADHMYQQCAETSQQLGLQELQLQARYNRAYLYFLRGHYRDALKSFRELRQGFEKSGSQRHRALCDLDMAEIRLYVGAPHTAIGLAKSAGQVFAELKMPYERAKAIAFLGAALMQNREPAAALQAFATAQGIFEAEGNNYWVAVLHLCRVCSLWALNHQHSMRAQAVRVRVTAQKLRIPAQTGAILALMDEITSDMDNHFDIRLRLSQILRLTRNRKN